jgi:hypothetical protein
MVFLLLTINQYLKTMKKVLILFLILMSICIIGSAQQALSAAGGSASGTGGTVSYTIGQVAYTNLTGTSGTITEGVQQPFEILVYTSLQDANDFAFECSAYPNPATDQVIVKIENYDMEKLHIRLYDANGKLVQNMKVVTNETIILLTSLPSGSYLLKILNSQNAIRSFKIIKYQLR